MPGLTRTAIESGWHRLVTSAQAPPPAVGLLLLGQGWPERRRQVEFILTAYLGEDYPPRLLPKLQLLRRAALSSLGARRLGSTLPKLPQSKGDYNLRPGALSIPCFPAAPKMCHLFSRHGKQPKVPNLPKQQLAVPVTQREGGAGVRMLASCRLRDGNPEEEMITSAILVAITGMWVLLL